MIVKIIPNDKAQPAGKLADAEVHFTDGEFEGLKLIGFAIWERRSGTGRNVTFPSRTYSVNGERRSFALRRTLNRLNLDELDWFLEDRFDLCELRGQLGRQSLLDVCRNIFGNFLSLRVLHVRNRTRRHFHESMVWATKHMGLPHLHDVFKLLRTLGHSISKPRGDAIALPTYSLHSETGVANLLSSLKDNLIRLPRPLRQTGPAEFTTWLFTSAPAASRAVHVEAKRALHKPTISKNVW